MFSLSDVVAELRSDLQKAMLDRAGEPAMHVRAIEIELEVAIEAGKSGGLKLGVLSLGADSTRLRTHRVKLTLTPEITRLADGRVLIGDLEVDRIVPAGTALRGGEVKAPDGR